MFLFYSMISEFDKLLKRSGLTLKAEHFGSDGAASDLHSLGALFESRLGDHFCGVLSVTRPRPLPSTSFPLHHSLILISFDAILYELLIASLNKQH
jgi:hypothetical protein